MRKHVWTVVCSGLVAACGGGGDGGTSLPAPLTITAGNQDAVAIAAAGAIVSVSGAGSVTASGSGSAGATAVTGVSRAVALRLAGERKRAQGAQPSAIPAETLYCPAGGTGVLSYQDTNGNGALDIGEGITFTYTNCKQTATDSLDGSIAITIASAGLAPGGIQFTGTMTISNLVAVDGTRSASLAGTVSASYIDDTSTQSRLSFVVGTTGLSSTITVGATPSQNITYEPGFTYAETSTTDINLTPLQTASTCNGGFSSNVIGGRVVIETQLAIVQPANTLYPNAGSIRVVGTGSALRLTVQSQTTVRQELDTNGDGTYEAVYTKDVPWTTLLPS